MKAWSRRRLPDAARAGRKISQEAVLYHLTAALPAEEWDGSVLPVVSVAPVAYEQTHYPDRSPAANDAHDF
jgi:FAD/FMN-containing dehydrogenase